MAKKKGKKKTAKKKSSSKKAKKKGGKKKSSSKKAKKKTPKKKMAKKKGGKKKSSSKKAKESDEELPPPSDMDVPEPESSGGGGLVAIPIISVLLLLWIILLKLDVYPPFYFQATDQMPIAIAAVLQILFIVLLALAYSAKAQKNVERAIKDEEIIEELRKTYAEHEEEVGKDIDGEEVDGEELLEVEPEYVEAEIIDDDEDLESQPSSQVAVKKDWGIIEYPPQITGGVYSDTLIPVGHGAILKLRTIVARACIICDKQVECWPKSRRQITKEDFKFNTECKGGLRRLGVAEI